MLSKNNGKSEGKSWLKKKGGGGRKGEGEKCYKNKGKGVGERKGDIKSGVRKLVPPMIASMQFKYYTKKKGEGE